MAGDKWKCPLCAKKGYLPDFYLNVEQIDIDRDASFLECLDQAALMARCDGCAMKHWEGCELQRLDAFLDEWARRKNPRNDPVPEKRTGQLEVEMSRKKPSKAMMRNISRQRRIERIRAEQVNRDLARDEVAERNHPLPLVTLTPDEQQLDGDDSDEKTVRRAPPKPKRAIAGLEDAMPFVDDHVRSIDVAELKSRFFAEPASVDMAAAPALIITGPDGIAVEDATVTTNPVEEQEEYIFSSSIEVLPAPLDEQQPEKPVKDEGKASRKKSTRIPVWMGGVKTVAMAPLLSANTPFKATQFIQAHSNNDTA
ncbi:unnamed protein product, partial [Mesorhabditis spiculigera]